MNAHHSFGEAYRNPKMSRAISQAAHAIAWTHIGAELDALEARLQQKARHARATAKRARRQGHLTKWQKFNACARVYEMTLCELQDMRVPF